MEETKGYIDIELGGWNLPEAIEMPAEPVEAGGVAALNERLREIYGADCFW